MALDFGLDFHTGGARINNFPQIRGQMDVEENQKLAEAFGTKYIVHAPFREKSLRREAAKRGKYILVYEAGESQRLRKNSIDEGVNGALRVMKFLGMRQEAPGPMYSSIHINSSSWLRSKAGGLYYSFVRPGEKVEKGQKVGIIAGPFGEFEKSVKSQFTGHVIAVNNHPVVNRGDALMHIGRESK